MDFSDFEETLLLFLEYLSSCDIILEPLEKLFVKVDISEHLRFMERVSVLGLATDDKSFEQHIVLLPRVKKRIKNYTHKIADIYAIMSYILLKDCIAAIDSIQFCNDVSKSRLQNVLRKLFKNDPRWIALLKNNKISIKSVKRSYVDTFVKKLRKNPNLQTNFLELQLIETYLLIINNQEKGAKSSQTVRK